MPQVRPFTPDELIELANRGYDVSKYDGRPVEFPDDPVPQTSVLAAGARSAAASALPSLAGGAGFAAGMAGASAGLAGGPLAPATVPLGFIAGAGLGYLGSLGAAKAQEAMLPDSVNQQLALDQQQHPTASMVGSIATLPLGGLNPSLAGPKAIATAIARRSINPQEIGIAARQALINSGIGAGLGGIQTAVEEKMQGHDLDPAAIARSAAIGTVMTHVNPIGRKLGFHPIPERTLDNPDALRGTFRSEGEPIENDRREPVVRIPVQGPVQPEIIDARAKAETPVQVARAPKIDPGNMSDAEVKAKLIELGRPAEYVNKIDPAFARRILAEGMKAQATDDTKTPLTQEIAQKLKDAQLSGMSPEYIATLRDELLAPHRVTLAKDSNLKGKGQAFVTALGQRIAKWNPTKVSPDTLPHEDFHHAYADWQAKAAAGDKQAARDLGHLERLSKPGLDAINEKRVAAGKEPWSLEEFIVSEQGNEFLKQQLDLDNENGKTGWTKWVNDTKALLATRGENPTLEQARRAANFRRVNEITEPGKAPQFGPTKMQEDNDKQAEDFTRYNNLVNSLKGKSLTEAFPIATEIEQIKNKYGGKPPTLPLERNEQIRQDQQDEISQLYGRSQGGDEGLEPTPGTAQSISRYGRSVDSDRSIAAVIVGTKPMMSLNRDTIQKAIELKDSNPALGLHLFYDNGKPFGGLLGKDQATVEHAAKVIPSSSPKTVGKLYGYTDKEIQDFIDRKIPTFDSQTGKPSYRFQEEGEGLDAEHIVLAAAKTTDPYKQWKLKQARAGLPTDDDAFRDALSKDAELQADMDTEPAFTAAIQQSVAEQQKPANQVEAPIEVPKVAPVEMQPAPSVKEAKLAAERAQKAPRPGQRSEQQIYDDRIAEQQQREARQAAERLAKEKPPTMEEVKARNKALLKQLGIDTTADQLDAEREVARVVARTTASKVQGPPKWDEAKPQWAKDVEASDAAKQRDSKRKAIEESNRYLAERKRQGRYQEEGDGLTTRSIKLLTNPREAKLPFNNANAANGDQLLGSLRNQLSPVEYDMLKQAGIEDAWKGKIVGQKDALEWVKENGPKVEVHSYGMEGKVSEAKKEYDKMTHEWYETLPRDKQGEYINEADYIFGAGDVKQALMKKGWSEENATKGARYKDLSEVVRKEPRDTSPRATSHYSSVSALSANEPMPEWTKTKSGKNVQRVDVVIPTHERTDNRATSKVPDDQAEGVLWQPDNLHENLPNTLGWAMIQYKTGPKGEKIAVIAEAQSRWGQEARKAKELYNEKLKKYGKELADAAYADTLKEEHPLLRDYNRLILKAAIEQARKEGATHIMVSDAETAMMTEGHDLAARHEYGTPEDEASINKQLKEQNKPALSKMTGVSKDPEGKWTIWNGDSSIGYINPDGMVYAHRYSGRDLLVTSIGMPTGKRIIDQEPGMRLNYDTILPKIAEELTGSKGEKVSLGEHKNAMAYKPEGNGWESTGSVSTGKPRDNLIFHNPDGTPKTDVSGQMYDIRPVSERLAKGDKFTLFNKYQGSDEGLTPSNPEKFKLTDLNKAIDKDFDKYDKLGITPPRDAWRTVDQVSQMNEDLQTGKDWSRNQDADEGLRANDMSKQGLWRGASGAFDRVREVSVPISEAFKRWEAYRDKIWGHAQTAIKDLQGIDKKAVDKAMALHRELFRHAKESEVNARLASINSGTSDVAKASRLLTAYYHDKIGNIRRELGYRHDGRLAGLNKAYVPDVLNDKTMDIFVNKSQSPEAEQLKTAWANHVFKESKGALKMKDIRDNINGYINALGGSRNNYNAVDFGALRKAEGYGLPESMREVDAVKTLSKYGRRAANDMAMFKELEMNPRIANALHLWNPITNKRHAGFDESTTLNQASQIKDAMKWVTGNFSSTMSRSTPQIQSAVRVVNNALLGTATGLRDTVSIPMNAIPYITSFADLGAFMRGVSNFRKESRNALETAAKQPNLDKLQFDTLNDAPDKFSHYANTLATLLRRYQGREALENFNRDVTFAAGKELAKQWIIGARSGHKGSIEMLKKFDTLVDGDVTKMTGAKLEEALNQIGKNFTDRNQGTYGGRGLPNWMIDSQFAPFFALQKWSIEKSNVIYKDVIKPAVEGKNFIPLLTYTAGTLLTGAAIQKLNEALTGRKAQDPTITEAVTKGTPHALVSELATIMQLGSFMGIVGDAMKGLSDVTHGKTPRNIVSFPTATFAADTGERTMQMIEAINQGENPMDVISQWSIDLMTKNIQAARMLANHTVNEQNVERSDKFRDMRVFSELEGNPAKAIATTNPYLNYQAKKFKQTGDAQEASAMLPELLSSAQSKAGQDYEKLSSNLRGLKANSYQTMPSPERQPLAFQRYYQYLVATQGKEAADARLKDYMHQSSVNSLKSSLVPSL